MADLIIDGVRNCIQMAGQLTRRRAIGLWAPGGTAGLRRLCMTN